MKITDEAKQILEDVLKENGVEGIRLYSVPGCCGPQFALSLDAPEESDRMEIINGIKVAVEAELTGTEELILDKDENDDEGLILIGASSCS